ncbi:MAG: FtsL-like putative cell division protein [Bacteroidia bacterium]
MSNKFRETPKQELKEKKQEYAEPKISATETTPPKNYKKGVLAKGLSAVFSGTFLTNEKTLKHTPFVLFLTLLAILYIANGYYADDKIREVNKTTNQLKELRSEFISTKSDLMFVSKQSEVAKAAEPLGIKEPVVPPMKIEIDTNTVKH